MMIPVPGSETHRSWAFSRGYMGAGNDRLLDPSNRLRLPLEAVRELSFGRSAASYCPTVFSTRRSRSATARVACS